MVVVVEGKGMRIDRLLVVPVEQTLGLGDSVFSPHQSQIWVIDKNEVNPLAGQTYVHTCVSVRTLVLLFVLDYVAVQPHPYKRELKGSCHLFHGRVEVAINSRGLNPLVPYISHFTRSRLRKTGSYLRLPSPVVGDCLLYD